MVRVMSDLAKARKQLKGDDSGSDGVGEITLQKCLLYFESVHGRPGTRQERNLVKPLYDRYKMIKHLLCVSPITTIVDPTWDDSDRDSDPAFVSPLDEVSAAAGLRETEQRKRVGEKFSEVRGAVPSSSRPDGERICQKEDRTPMKEEYQEYKQLKAKLRLLEVLLSNKTSPRPCKTRFPCRTPFIPTA
ncbi:hypothetical protein INR49_020700, partial [Caranx melampygus]